MLLPPSRKGREYELRALGLRDFAGMRDTSQRLDPYSLASFANLMVVSLDEIDISEEAIVHLTGAGKDEWSGGACSQTLPDGRKLIILNPTHSSKRQKATLMEEVSHVFLGHKPSRLAVKTESADGKTRARDYHEDIEEQAYSVGAAALVPYEGLRKFVIAGKASWEIAEIFAVSKPLVEFRIKTTRLWQRYLAEQEAKQY